MAFLLCSPVELVHIIPTAVHETYFIVNHYSSVNYHNTIFHFVYPTWSTFNVLFSGALASTKCLNFPISFKPFLMDAYIRSLMFPCWSRHVLADASYLIFHVFRWLTVNLQVRGGPATTPTWPRAELVSGQTMAVMDGTVGVAQGEALTAVYIEIVILYRLRRRNGWFLQAELMPDSVMGWAFIKKPGCCAF